MAFLRALSTIRSKFFRRSPSSQYYFSSRFMTLKFSDEVQQAKQEKRPILALESTIITHGMPYPQNLETALQVETIVREQGAVPATVAILNGEMTIGLTETQIKYLAQAKGVVKASRRDLAPVIASKLDGATTVAGTIIAAELANIPVFATGGIGGVHREGERTMDVSADLTELSRSRTLVVCSGVKSILDIGRTLEYLETQGVCVSAFGESYDFPAFYTTKSGYRAPHRTSSAAEAAKMLLCAHSLQLTSGIVVAVPVPKEFAMDDNIIQSAISQALDDATKKGIHGKEVTPFLLAAVAKVTEGASLKANIALIKNNARVGADIAVEFNKLKYSDNAKLNRIPIGNVSYSNNFGEGNLNGKRGFHTSCRKYEIGNVGIIENDIVRNFSKNDLETGGVVVIGGANVDRTYKVKEGVIKLDGSTHPCEVAVSGGGVGRNIGEALWRLGSSAPVHFITAIGDDADGQFLTRLTPGLIVDGSVVEGGRTSSYAAVLDSNGECALGLGDMTLHNHITLDMINKNMHLLEKASIVVFDGNPPLNTVEHILNICKELQKPVFFEPTDRRKATKPFLNKHTVEFGSPNIAELVAISLILQPNTEISIHTINNIEEILKLCAVVSDCINCIIVTLGENGVLIYNKNKGARLYPVNKLVNIKNVSGAGDCFASGFIHSMILGLEEEHCVSMGIHVAQEALHSDTTVPTTLKSYKDVKKSKYITLI